MSEQGGNKRQGGKDGGGGNKKRKYLTSIKGGGPAIPTGAKGILVTCEGGRERRSSDEVVAMLEEAFEALGAGEGQAGPSAAGDGAGTTSVEAKLAAELAVLKDKRKDRFRWHDTGVRGSYFIVFPEDEGCLSPVDVVLHLLRRAKETGTAPGRFTLRLLPVTHACFADIEHIKTMAPDLLLADFPAGEDAVPVPFAVEVEQRACERIKRMDVINAVIHPIQQPPHKVNLTAPAKVVLVQMIRNACGASVVTDYRGLARFNLHRAAGEEEGDDAGGGGAGAGKGAPAPEVANDGDGAAAQDGDDAGAVDGDGARAHGGDAPAALNGDGAEVEGK